MNSITAFLGTFGQLLQGQLFPVLAEELGPVALAVGRRLDLPSTQAGGVPYIRRAVGWGSAN